MYRRLCDSRPKLLNTEREKESPYSYVLEQERMLERENERLRTQINKEISLRDAYKRLYEESQTELCETRRLCDEYKSRLNASGTFPTSGLEVLPTQLDNSAITAGVQESMEKHEAQVDKISQLCRQMQTSFQRLQGNILPSTKTQPENLEDKKSWKESANDETSAPQDVFILADTVGKISI